MDECLRALAEHTYYDRGDRAARPFVSALPHGDDTYPRLVVSVKGSNNGTFYVASPVELPWLSDHLTTTIEGADRPKWSAEDHW